MPPFDIAALSAEQRAVYDAIVDGPRAASSPFGLTDADGQLVGPFAAMLLSPAVGAALQQLGTTVRYRTAFSDRAREIAILLVAHHEGSGFEIYAHEAVGRHAGLSGDELAALRAARFDGFEDVECVVATTTRELVADGALSSESFTAARAALGAEGVFELTTLVGYYSMLALQMRVFGVAEPE